MALRVFKLTVGATPVALSSVVGATILGKFRNFSITADEDNTAEVKIGGSDVVESGGSEKWLWRVPAPDADAIPAPPLLLETTGTELQELYAVSPAEGQVIYFGGFI